MTKKAFSLLEMILVLVVAAVMAIVAVRYYSEVKSREKQNALVQQFNDITTAVSKCIQINVPDSAGAAPTINCYSLSDLIKAGYLDNSIKYNPWGNEAAGANNTLATGSDNFSFKVTASDVPPVTCIKIENSAKTTLPTGATVSASSTQCVYNGKVQQ